MDSVYKSYFKKLLGVVVVLCAFIMFCQNVLADTTYSITIENSSSGHTYEVYQIFTGDLATDSSGNKILSNLKWGASVATHTSWDSATAAANSIAVSSNNTETQTAADESIKTFLNSITLESTSYKSTSTLSQGTYIIDGLEPGYYLIKDKDSSLANKNDSYTSYILKIARNVSSKAKSAIPTAEKKVKDINDTSDTSAGDWEDSADYDIGDTVPFQISGVVASNYGDYTVYKFIFHDTISKGLNLDTDSIKVYLTNNGKKEQITTGFSVNVLNKTDETFNVTFTDLKKITDISAGSVITIEYNATLTSDAVLGSAGNSNQMYLEYSNNPNSTSDTETGHTPTDVVKVFTYQLTVNKVDQSNNALTGAAFTLEKKLKDGSKKTCTSSVSTDGTVFTFKGLDDGDYILTETQTPSGYNSIAPITFTVSASHDAEKETPALTSLKATLSDSNSATGEITISADNSSGILTANVTNVKGKLLPETGGMGTRIFYALGCIFLMMAFAGICVKKNMSDK